MRLRELASNLVIHTSVSFHKWQRGRDHGRQSQISSSTAPFSGVFLCLRPNREDAFVPEQAPF